MWENYLEMEDINYQFERISNLIRVIKTNYYDKDNVDFKRIEDCYDLCISYKDVATLLETIGEIASNTNIRFNSILSKQKDIKSE